MKATVVYHSADYDGLFCREIARKFLPDAELIGWDYWDPKLNFPEDGMIYVMDLSPECFIKTPENTDLRLVWIDHHKSAIQNWPTTLPGYRVDGVAACRLAWAYFTLPLSDLPSLQDFKWRKVPEPYAITLAGEYDIWDHSPSNQDDVAFQFGLDCQEIVPWAQLLSDGWGGKNVTDTIVAEGKSAMQCYAKRDSDIMRTRSFFTRFEDLTFLCLNTARCNSKTFAALDVPESSHDALLAFYWNGKHWTVSLYHAAHRKEIDLSLIAVKHGGGGHRGACGFTAKTLPFLQATT